MSDFDIIKIQTSGIHVSRIHIDGINANENIAGGHHAGWIHASGIPLVLTNIGKIRKIHSYLKFHKCSNFKLSSQNHGKPEASRGNQLWRDAKMGKETRNSTKD